jgi:hypothetical protein
LRIAALIRALTTDQHGRARDCRTPSPAKGGPKALYEMVNIYPADGGLPMTVWAGAARRGMMSRDIPFD